jgi:hypothetical protein
MEISLDSIRLLSSSGFSLKDFINESAVKLSICDVGDGDDVVGFTLLFVLAVEFDPLLLDTSAELHADEIKAAISKTIAS